MSQNKKKKCIYLAFWISFRYSFDLPAKQGRYTNDPAKYPHETDHHYGTCRRPLLQIVDGLRDRPIPVQCYQTQVHDRCGAQEDVEGCVYVTPPISEYPIAHQLVGQRKRHDDYAQEEIGHGQAGYEPVLDVFQRLFGHNGYDDQHVTDDYDDHEHDDHNGGNHDFRHRIRRRIHRLEYVVCPVRVHRDVATVQVIGTVLVDQKSELVLVDFEHHARHVGQVFGCTQRFHFNNDELIRPERQCTYNERPPKRTAKSSREVSTTLISDQPRHWQNCVVDDWLSPTIEFPPRLPVRRRTLSPKVLPPDKTHDPCAFSNSDGFCKKKNPEQLNTSYKLYIVHIKSNVYQLTIKIFRPKYTLLNTRHLVQVTFA